MTRNFYRQPAVINTFNSKRTGKPATVPSFRRKYTGTTVWTERKNVGAGIPTCAAERSSANRFIQD